MASFATFGDLRQRILTECIKPANSTFDEEIPGFVALAESRMWYGSGKPGDALYCEPVRVRAMETSTAALAFTSGVGSLSGLTGFLDKRNLYWPSTPPSEPNYEPPAVFWPQKDNTATTSTTRVVGYTIEGDAIYLRPLLTGNATFLYFKKLTALISNSDTNWLLTNAPAVYFYGTLIEAWRHIRNDTKLQEAIAAYQAAVGGVNNVDARARFSGGRLVRRSTW